MDAPRTDLPPHRLPPRRLGVALVVLLLFGAAVVRVEGEPSEHAAAGRILFLHHSTGQCIWDGGLEAWIRAWNAKHGTNHVIREQAFPKEEPYGWENYPYDYYNIWVKHAGPRPYRGEPTLEMLAPDHDLIVFKHCFPVSSIESDTGQPDLDSQDKRIGNYKLQYLALRRKLRSFGDTRFLVWTGAALLERETDAASARRARAFFDWVKTTWDRPGDNIHVWDFHALETEGSLYLQAAYAEGDSHPNATFSRRVAPCLGQRIVDVLAGRGDRTDVTGRPAEPLEPAPPAAPTASPSPMPPTPPTPPTPPPSAGPGRWAFDDAESAARVEKRWGAQARRVEDGEGHALRLDFPHGRAEDWGEYGPHRIVETRVAEGDVDVSKHRYLALRVKSDRDVLVPLALVTHARPVTPAEARYFSFTAYLHLKSGPWRWMVFDLTALELEVENAAFYERAGSPARPNTVSSLRLSIHQRDAEAAILLDDVLFLGDLPETLRPHLK